MSRPARQLRHLVAIVATAVAITLAGGSFAAASTAGSTTAQDVHEGLLERVIHEVPTYRPDQVHWRLSLSLDHWGQTDWTTHTITISVLVPLPYLYSVVVHEWSHELSVLDYGGNVWPAIHAMNRHFGGGGKTGIQGTEMAADCMAILQGATWTNYTNCTRPSWRRDARRLVDGHRI
jgi:hypothetical protein